MKLPADNSVALAAGNDRLVLDPSDPPAPAHDDVLALLPAWARDAVSPVRDAVLAGWRAAWNLLWARTGQLAAQAASPRNASGPALGAWGAELRRPRALGEGEGAYRARLLNPPDVVSPAAIRAAVDALVAAETGVRVAYLEPATDAAFAAPAAGAPAWCAFAQPAGGRVWARYPDNPNPAVGAYAAPVAGRAEFWIVLSGDPGADAGAAYASAPAAAASLVDHAAPAAGGGVWTTAARYAASGRLALSARVIADVEARRAAGVRWVLLIDPTLEQAV